MRDSDYKLLLSKRSSNDIRYYSSRFTHSLTLAIQEGTKTAEESIKRSRALLNENRLVFVKPPTKETTPPAKPILLDPTRHTPATPYIPPADVNRLVGLYTAPITTKTTLITMHDPAYRAEAHDDPKTYFPKYFNLPKVSETRDGISSSNDDIDEGVE